MKPYIQQSAKSLAQAIMAKQISAYELTEAYIQRIEAINPKLNAVVQFNPDRALSLAKHYDNVLAKGRVIGPLHGVPFTLKDVYNTQGDIVSAGSLGLKDNIATEDATIVKRLKQAGAILLGKCNTPEFETAPEADNLIYGKTLNPYDLTRHAGGSSGGGAAIVAACGSAFDVGADTGGSLRVPAHYCGIATVRPTVRRIPSSGVVYGLRKGLGGLLTTEGPLSRYVEDLPLLLNILQGPDGIDPRMLPLSLGNMDDISIKNLSIAYQVRNQFADTSEETKNMINHVAQLLSGLGAKVTEDVPKEFDQGFDLFRHLFGANTYVELQQAIKELQVPEVSPLLSKVMEYIKPLTCDLPTFMSYWQEWDLYRSQVLSFFNDYDALIYPVSPNDALAADASLLDEDNIEGVSYTWLTSTTLLPIVVVRAGTSADGLPLGIQNN